MWLSMTGYGAAETALGDRTLRVEMRSVNQKNREARVFSSPRNLAWEYEIQQLLNRGIARGKIDAYVNVLGAQAGGASSGAALNRLRGRALHLRLQLGAAFANVASRLIVEDEEDTAPDTDIVMATAQAALAALIASRAREGEGLRNVVAGQRQEIDEAVARFVALKPEEAEQRQRQLQERLTALRDGSLAEADRRRLEEELTFQLIRGDVTEEIDRIRLHLDALTALLDQTSPVGKQLDMLAQELGRETHTLASKSGHVAVKDEALRLRAIVDRLREQVQNIE